MDVLIHSVLIHPPTQSFAAVERVAVSVAKSPYVRFDLDDYSIAGSIALTLMALPRGVEPLSPP